MGGDLFGVVVVFVEELDDEGGAEVWEEILDLSHEAYFVDVDGGC